LRQMKNEGIFSMTRVIVWLYHDLRSFPFYKPKIIG